MPALGAGRRHSVRAAPNAALYGSYPVTGAGHLHPCSLSRSGEERWRDRACSGQRGNAPEQGLIRAPPGCPAAGGSARALHPGAHEDKCQPFLTSGFRDSRAPRRPISPSQRRPAPAAAGERLPKPAAPCPSPVGDARPAPPPPANPSPRGLGGPETWL